MKYRFLVTSVFCGLLGFNTGVHGQVAGTEVITGAGGPDGWTNVLYIEESNPFNFGAGGQGVLTYTNFWNAGRNAVGQGLYTPFVAEPLVNFPETGDDFVIRAIGTTREAGVDYKCTGEFQFPFHDTETFVIENGWVAGFLSSDVGGERTDALSPVPFVASDVEGWLTGSSTAGNFAPAIVVGEPILEGVSGTNVDAFGFRQYEFNVSGVAGNTKPALNAGGKVGDACPAPVEPKAGQIGAPLPLTNGTPDGWSGIPVMYGHELPAGETVNVVRYYAADDRALDVEEGLYAVTPLIVKQEGGSLEDGDGFFSIYEVGPTHIPEEIGENEFVWGSSPIPDDGELYHPAALQWLDGLDDGTGGVIAFGDGGEGMHYFNVDTTEYIPNEDLGEVEAGLELSGLQTHTSGIGGRYYQLNFEMSSGSGLPGDFNNDEMRNELDLNELAAAIRGASTDSKYDLNDDGSVNADDHNYWVKDIKTTWIGDSNFDGEFSSSDFVTVFVPGKYETGQDAGWEEGDWDGDGKFDSSDFVAAFIDGGYEQGPRWDAPVVPEPSSLVLVGGGALMLLLRRRK